MCPQWAGPRRAGEAASGEWPQARLFLAQTLGFLASKGLGVGEGLDTLSQLS